MAFLLRLAALFMTYNYCTLFDSFFLSRGLALYDSLKRTTPDIKLYLFPFDEKSDKILRALNLQDVVVVSQSQFETQELLNIKAERTRGEYCWTCTSVIIDFCLKTFDLPYCTYLDADLFFFSNANVLVDEMGDKSVLITDHRYSPRYDQSKTSGKYCVQFMTFKNDQKGLEALAWWKEQCIAWCYDKLEDGKFGDQKYLDDWPERFQGIFESQNEGGGLAPWNIQQYDILKKGDVLSAKSIKTTKEWTVVFYHFHALRLLRNGMVDLGAYALNPEAIEKIYQPYLQEISSQNKMLKERFELNYPIQSYTTKGGMPIFLHKIARRFLGVFNIFRIADLSATRH